MRYQRNTQWNKQKLNKLVVCASISACMLGTTVLQPMAVYADTTTTMTQVESRAVSKTIQLSAKTASLTVGKTKKLTLKNTSKTPKWSSSKTSVATVSKSGVVKAVKAGTATITATLNGKKYTCKVTVKAPTAKDTLKKVSNAVKKAYGADYIPNMSFDSTYLSEVVGLKSSLYDAVVAEGPSISFQVDTFISVHAKSGKKAEVEKALKAYRNYLINETMQYPMNVPKINASKVVTVGDYVFFVMLGKRYEGNEDNEAAMLKHYEKQNEIAISAIKKAL